MQNALTSGRTLTASVVAPLLLLLAMPSAAQSLKGGHFACLSEQRFDELVTMVGNDDRRGAQHLVDSRQCFVTKAGVPISILESSWSGQVKIRAYANGGSVDLWTFRENIQD